MPIDESPVELSADERAQVETALANVTEWVLDQRQLVSYQWLSNELSIDAWLARAVLDRFIRENRDAVDAVWLLSGLTTAINRFIVRSHGKAGHSSSSSASSSDSSGSVVSVHEVTLVADAELEFVKASFTAVYSLHPYSVLAKPAGEAAPMKDFSLALHNLQMTQLLAMYDEADVMADNPLRDGRFSSIDASTLIQRTKRGRPAPKATGNGHAEDLTKQAINGSAQSPSSSSSPPSSSSKKAAVKPKNALASMFSRQAATMQSARPASASVSASASNVQSLQDNALTVLPAESPKMEQSDAKQPKAKRSPVERKASAVPQWAQRKEEKKEKLEEKKQQEPEQVEEEEEEAEEEEVVPMEDGAPVESEVKKDTSPAGKSKAKASSKNASAKSRSGKAKPRTKKKKRKANDDDFVYPNPYDSMSDVEDPSEAAEEAAVPDQEEAAYNVDGFVPSSYRDDEEDAAAAPIKAFFTAAPASASPSAGLPALRKRKQVTRMDAKGYLVTEWVDEEDEEAEKQRKEKEAAEEIERAAADQRRKAAKEKERRDKERAEQEEQQRKEEEKKAKREAKKEEKKASKASSADTSPQQPTADALPSKKRKGTADDSDEVEVDEEREAKKAKPSKETSGKGKEKEGGKEIGKGKVEGKSGAKAAAEAKPKNNSSILSFFSKK